MSQIDVLRVLYTVYEKDPKGTLSISQMSKKLDMSRNIVGMKCRRLFLFGFLILDLPEKKRKNAPEFLYRLNPRSVESVRCAIDDK
jgi:hypothetical protein